MLKRTLTAVATVLALSTCSVSALAAKGDAHVLLTTSAGEIELELNNQKAPVSVKNFVDYVNGGFYNNTTFHRVIPGFMVQGAASLPICSKNLPMRRLKMKRITAC